MRPVDSSYSTELSILAFGIDSISPPEDFERIDE